ncbi:MAG: hypothetical protein R3F34_10010 [Planctomycetota bacterium]
MSESRARPSRAARILRALAFALFDVAALYGGLLLVVSGWSADLGSADSVDLVLENTGDAPFEAVPLVASYRWDGERYEQVEPCTMPRPLDPASLFLARGGAHATLHPGERAHFSMEFENGGGYALLVRRPGGPWHVDDPDWNHLDLGDDAPRGLADVERLRTADPELVELTAAVGDWPRPTVLTALFVAFLVAVARALVVLVRGVDRGVLPARHSVVLEAVFALLLAPVPLIVLVLGTAICLPPA